MKNRVTSEQSNGIHGAKETKALLLFFYIHVCERNCYCCCCCYLFVCLLEMFLKKKTSVRFQFAHTNSIEESVRVSKIYLLLFVMASILLLPVDLMNLTTIECVPWRCVYVCALRCVILSAVTLVAGIILFQNHWINLIISAQIRLCLQVTTNASLFATQTCKHRHTCAYTPHTQINIILRQARVPVWCIWIGNRCSHVLFNS